MNRKGQINFLADAVKNKEISEQDAETYTNYIQDLKEFYEDACMKIKPRRCICCDCKYKGLPETQVPKGCLNYDDPDCPECNKNCSCYILSCVYFEKKGDDK